MQKINSIDMDECGETNDENEWDQMKTFPIIDLSDDQSISRNYQEYHSQFDIVKLEDVSNYFESLDITEQLPKIKPNVSKRRIYRFLTKIICLNRYSLNRYLIDERNRIFAIALHPFDNKDNWQNKFLTSIYRKLTGQMLECRRFGNHWEKIGFQGTDPATDFRGVGLLGLLQLLFFVLMPETSNLAKEIYKLSLDSHQHFPFAVMGTNVTQISLQVLREGLLNKECNQTKSVIKVFNWFYCGLFFHLFKIWKSDKKTIVDSGFVLKEIKIASRKNVRKIIVDMLNYRNELEKRKSDNEIEFSNLGEIFANSESQSEFMNSEDQFNFEN